MQVVGDHLQPLVAEQRAGDRLGGGADVDEQRGVVGNLRGDGLGDALLLLAHLPGAHGVGGVVDARRLARRAAVGAAQQAVVGQLVDVAADGLRGDGEGLGQLVDADVAALAGEVEDALLTGRQNHAGVPFFGPIIGCRGGGFTAKVGQSCQIIFTIEHDPRHRPAEKSQG
ncbi:hypothetical protein D9M68_717550 [compost metagenome]